MNYFKEGTEYQAVENKVARVFGGNVELEGGYVTDEISENANPIQVRDELALSQTEFYGDDGELKRNMASDVVRGTIYTTPDNEIIDLNGGLTGEYLEWSTVEPQGELEGGGNEFVLPVPFDTVVEIDSVDPLIHHSTPGWEAYVEAEKDILDDEPEDTL